MQGDELKSRPPLSDGQAPAAEAAPFEEIYCAAFAALDRQWLAQKATYMEFPAVMKCDLQLILWSLVDRLRESQRNLCCAGMTVAQEAFHMKCSAGHSEL